MTLISLTPVIDITLLGILATQHLKQKCRPTVLHISSLMVRNYEM